MRQFFLLILLIIITQPVLFGQDTTVYSNGSSFLNGFARIENGENIFYIDSTGKKAFDRILQGDLDMLAASVNADAEDASYLLDTAHGIVALMPEKYLKVLKNGKIGILSKQGKWLLKPIYDSVATRFRQWWLVKKEGKKSLFAPQGFLLPFRFENVYNMNGQFFNVRLNGKWGLYNKLSDSLVVPCIYDDMDYCYGCGDKGDYVFAAKNGKWGVIDFTGKMMLPFEYDHMHVNMRSDKWIECLYKNGKRLRINLESKKEDTMAHPENGDREEEMAGGFTRRRQDDKWGMFNTAGDQVLPFKYDFIRYDADEVDGYYLPAPYVAIRINDRHGVVDTAGAVIVRPASDEWVSNIDSFFITSLKNKRFLLNSSGDTVVPGAFDDIHKKKIDYHCDSCREAFILLKRNDLSGFYNPASHIYVPPKYNYIYTDILDGWAAENYIEVRSHGNKKRGLVDLRTGEEVIPAIYDYVDVDNLPPGKVIVKDDGKAGLYDLDKRKFVIPLKYSNLTPSEDSSLLIATGGVRTGPGLEGLIDYSGKLRCPLSFDDITKIDSVSFILIKRDSQMNSITSFFNKQTDQVRAFPYNIYINLGTNSLLNVWDHGEAKLYNVTKDQVLKGDYAEGGFPEQIGQFVNHIASFKKGDKMGFMSDQGEVVVPPLYDSVSSFYHGVAVVVNFSDSSPINRYGYIDSTGKVIVPIIYAFHPRSDFQDYFRGDWLMLFKEKNELPYISEGIARRDGIVLVPPVYDQVIAADDGNYFLVQQNKKYGILNRSGKDLLPFEFDNILLNQRVYYSGDKVKITFPLMVNKGNTWLYYKRDGQALPIKIKNVISPQSYW